MAGTGPCLRAWPDVPVPESWRRLPRRVRAVPTDVLDRLVAGPASIAVVVLFALVLMQQRPGGDGEVRPEPLARLYFIARPSPGGAASPPVPGRSVDAGMRRAPLPASASEPAQRVEHADTHADTRHRLALYGRDGRVLVPEGATALPAPARAPPGMGGNAQAQAGRPFDRVNPVDYRETRFDRVWRGKGTAGDAALEDAHGTVEGGMVAIPLGTGDQPARARPPPEVRFNPALHERTADLGSEATGDAYKAAPIASEPVPGLEGAASRAVREQLATLGRDFAGCRKSLFDDLARPIRLHLSQLERVEYAFAHGADPVRAEHLLPREADTAYNLARRAVWHARMKLSSCPR